MEKLKQILFYSGFFERNEQGELLFYPWQKPGEAYYLTNKSGYAVFLLFNYFKCLLFFLFAGAVYLEGIGYINTVILLYFIFFIFFFCYLLFAWSIHKNFKAYIVPRDIRESKTIKKSDGKTDTLKLDCRLDTQDEFDYYRNGGILHYVLRQLAR